MNISQLNILLKTLEAESKYLLYSSYISDKSFIAYIELLSNLFDYKNIDNEIISSKILEIEKFKVSQNNNFISKIGGLFRERFGRITNNTFEGQYTSLSNKKKYVLGVLDKISAIKYHLNTNYNID